MSFSGAKNGRIYLIVAERRGRLQSPGEVNVEQNNGMGLRYHFCASGQILARGSRLMVE
jgi:hypothetical protein